MELVPFALEIEKEGDAQVSISPLKSLDSTTNIYVKKWFLDTSIGFQTCILYSTLTTLRLASREKGEYHHEDVPCAHAAAPEISHPVEPTMMQLVLILLL